MKVIYTKKHLSHNPSYEIYDGVRESYAEKPERLQSIVDAITQDGGYEFIMPKRFSINNIRSLHHDAYIEFLSDRSSLLKKDQILYPSYFMRDTYAPVVKGTYQAARTSVDVALTGAQMISRGVDTQVYALCRPPGHHAECNAMGGYCYFNNAAIAANYLSKTGKVAILDVDFHHGNGTQAMFYDRDDILYVSIHADPKVKFPYISGFSNERGRGLGLGYTKNYPLSLGVNDETYMGTLEKAINNVKKFQSDFLVISLGFDTYEKDPIGGFKLTIPFYKSMANQIAGLNVPSLIIQEGGYNVEDLGKMAISFMSGFAKKIM